MDFFKGDKVKIKEDVFEKYPFYRNKGFEKNEVYEIRRVAPLYSEGHEGDPSYIYLGHTEGMTVIMPDGEIEWVLQDDFCPVD